MCALVVRGEMPLQDKGYAVCAVQKSQVAIGWDDVAEMMPLTEVAAGGFVPHMRMRTSGTN